MWRQRHHLVKQLQQAAKKARTFLVRRQLRLTGAEGEVEVLDALPGTIGATRSEEDLRNLLDATAASWGPRLPAGVELMNMDRSLLLELCREVERALLEPAPPPSNADEWRTWQKSGLQLAKAGRYAEALDPLRRAVELRRSEPQLSNLGVALMRLGRYAEAQGAFDEAFRLKPTSEAVQGNLAALRARRERDEL